ncbi:MAG: diguanylate cyclase [Phycisphaerae bacterium]|nr:diguanylate cyclase [Phycisphaerae bacterium]MDW8261161.1 diguanylate cyclase [Phycisphaerales bacterium]
MAKSEETLRLLVVEDDPDQRDLICETLQDHFGRGTTVGVGSRGEALATDLASFDLILSDYNLPDGSGMELLKAVSSRCATPVILVTGENVGQTAVEAIRNGATDYVVKFGDYLFTIPLVVEKNLMVARIKRENLALQQQLIEKNRQLEMMAATDPLTGLYNRRHFGTVVEQLFSEAERYSTDLACVMIDMDGFKQLNDGCGHQVGDRILQLAGGIIRNNLRRADVAARYGGDEFVMLLPQAGQTEASHAAERLRQEFRSASAAALKRQEGLTLSIGIASVHANRPSSADQLVASADSALYQAKAAGRDRIHLLAGRSATPSPASGVAQPALLT